MKIVPIFNATFKGKKAPPIIDTDSTNATNISETAKLMRRILLLFKGLVADNK